MSAISSGVSAVVRRLPVAMETLCGMLRDFERVFNTDQRRLGLLLKSILADSKNSSLLSLIARFTKAQPCVSYRLDPGAVAINAFHMSWKCHLLYAFSPFCLISRVLQKIQQEKSSLLVVPKWPTQIWWPELMRILVSSPILLPTTKNTLYLPKQSRDSTSSLPQAGTNPLPLVGRLHACQGLSKEASEIIRKLWHSGTAKHYRTYPQKWDLFCSRKKH